MVRFSIVAVHYEGVTDKDTLQTFVDSLKNQTFKDFELVILHDGPMKEDWGVDFYDLKVVKYVSLKRANIFGHNLRTIGMKISSGEYIFHTNTDNLYYPTVFQILNLAIETSNQQVFVLKCRMKGLEYKDKKIFYSTPRNYDKSIVIDGVPLCFGNVDLMQVCIKKSLWVKVGYWYDLSEQSDGRIYEHLGSLFGYESVPLVIGEHY